MGLRLRLALTILIPLVAILGIFAYIKVDQDRAIRREDFTRHTEITSRAIQLAVEHALRHDSPADVAQLLSRLVVKQAEIVQIRLIDPSLQTSAASDLLPGAAGPTVGRLRLVMDTGQPDAVDWRWRGTRLHTQILPLRPRGESVTGALEITYIAASLDAALLSANYGTALATALLFLVLLVTIGLALQRAVLRPVASLMQGIQRVAEGQLDVPVPVARRDELGRVAEAFNAMAARLLAARQELVAETERSLDLARQLHRTESLATAGKLCSSIAHEIGTPLNVIAGRTELVLQALPDDSPYREDLSIALAQIDHVARIIRAALDPFQPRKADVRPTSLASVLDIVLPLVRHTAKRRRVTLAVSAAPDLRLLVDAGHLQQVLINLLMNALEAVPEGGRVELAARRVTEGDRPVVELSVSDNGPGIPPDVLPRIFEPFYTTKPQGEGTGLGLAVSRDLVTDNDGELRVASPPGAGATFTVVLPEASAAPDTPR
ncbi:MAG: hypothetical protein DMD79_05980 [Candidatus Rokuibacteriota bacterium]|nr:MAG: hypothetical protein DMD79_05980 [Candidatus Rokubacteria bacterium]